MKAQYFKGSKVADQSSRFCVLFDPKDGRIVHIHGLTVLGSEARITDKDLEARAVERAKAFGREVAGLRALHLPISAMWKRGPVKVNEAGNAVVPFAKPLPLDIPSRRSRT
jgi:hypothetical protein